ncbi:MAG: HAD family phosphatase [Clostridiales bacterium]|nr:HAD family phosphatase [Clostridiales bacterium]
MSVQAIAFDLDDTLLRDDRSISPYTISVLRRAAGMGIHIVPASGRTSSSMRRLVDQIGCASCYVCCNGAEVRAPDHTIIMQELLPVDIARQVAAWAAKHDVYAQTYDEYRFYFNKYGKYAEDYKLSSSLEGEYVGDLEAFITQPTTKILLMDEPVRIAELLHEAQTIWEGSLSLTCSKPYFLEINPLRATKGNALKWIAQRHGFPMTDFIAFGDSLNDTSMLAAAGTGVAMANAREDVKARADVTCRSNEEDGVAHYIENNVL